MHVLIFTGQFGMGHIAAAQAVQEEILRQEPTASVTVLDIVEDCFPQLHRLVYGCFDFTVNYCSGVYNMLNRMAGRYRCTPMKRTMAVSYTHLDVYKRQSTGSVQSIFNPELLLLHLGLGSGTHPDHSNTAGQTSQTLLQLLTVILRGGAFKLVADHLGCLLYTSRCV